MNLILNSTAGPKRHDINLWIVPLKISGMAIVLFGVTVTLDMLAANHVIRIPAWFTMGGIDDARAILGAMLGCVSTVLALIFSVALLVLSMVANLFGPRLLYRFVQDWVTQVCIGLFMGAFIYVFLVFLVTHQDSGSSFIPQVSLITSWFVVLGAFGFLVFYSHRVAALIQNPDAIGRIVDDLRKAAGNSTNEYAAKVLDASEEERLAKAATDSAAVYSTTSGYLQEIDREALIDAAEAAEALILLPSRPGQFVLKGERLALVSPAARKDQLASVIERSVLLGRHRVLAQDIEFGIAQIVEVAIRALSPAINDTFTGIACVDFLGESLALLAEAPGCHGRWFDAKSTLRLQVRPLKVRRLIKQAFDQIRQAAADNPAVSIRLMSTIERLAPRMQFASERVALLEQANAVWETASPKVVATMDRKDLFAAWQSAREALGGMAAEGDWAEDNSRGQLS